MAPDATARFDTVRGAVHAFLTSSLSDICLPSAIEGWEDVAPLAAYVERIYAAEGPCPLPVLPVAFVGVMGIWVGADGTAADEEDVRWWCPREELGSAAAAANAGAPAATDAAEEGKGMIDSW